MNRKVWGGNRTDAGAVTQGRVMTIFLRTAHQKGADAVVLLVDLARAPVPGVVEGLTLRPRPIHRNQLPLTRHSLKSPKRAPVSKLPLALDRSRRSDPWNSSPLHP